MHTASDDENGGGGGDVTLAANTIPYYDTTEYWLAIRRRRALVPQITTLFGGNRYVRLHSSPCVSARHLPAGGVAARVVGGAMHRNRLDFDTIWGHLWLGRKLAQGGQ